MRIPELRSINYINVYLKLMVYGGGRKTLTASVKWRSAVDWATATQRCRSSCLSEVHVGLEAVLDHEDNVEKTENLDHRENQVDIIYKHN